VISYRNITADKETNVFRIKEAESSKVNKGKESLFPSRELHQACAIVQRQVRKEKTNGQGSELASGSRQREEEKKHNEPPYPQRKPQRKGPCVKIHFKKRTVLPAWRGKPEGDRRKGAGGSSTLAARKKREIKKQKGENRYFRAVGRKKSARQKWRGTTTGPGKCLQVKREG